MEEIELKFDVSAASRTGLEKELRRGSVQRERLRAIYFDTADERLATHAVALRLRQAGRQWVQTAKAATADALRRLEHEVAVPVPKGGGPPALDLSRHDGTPAGAAVRVALGDAPGAHALLAARFRTDVSRLTRVVRVAGARVELAFDVGSVSAGARSQPICEFELELKSGQPAALVGLAAKWAERHGLVLSTISKAERGACVARGAEFGAPRKASVPRVDAGAGCTAFFVAVLESCLGQVLGNASELSAGAHDEELVHQLRIGLRRMRSALRDLGDFAGGVDPAWEPVLRDAFGELGAHRDLAIVVPAVRAEIVAAGAPPFPDPQPVHLARPPGAVVRDPALQRTLLALLAFCQAAPAATATEESAAELRAGVGERLEELRRSVARDARRFAELDPPRQHRVRKRLKRLRYLCEFAAPIFGAKKVERYLAHWRKAQDALGDYNDQRIAADIFRAQAETEPHAWFVVGWLAAHQRASVKPCRSALRVAAKARPFWRD